MVTNKKNAETAESTPAKKAKKPRAKKTTRKASDAPGQQDELVGKRYTHGKRSEWGVGTVVEGAENLLVISWSDGVERRTSRAYMDQLIEVP